MTSSNIEPEDAPQSTHSNSNGGRLPPPINWATYPGPRSLPATPKRSQTGHLYPGTPQNRLRASVDVRAIQYSPGRGYYVDIYDADLDDTAPPPIINFGLDHSTGTNINPSPDSVNSSRTSSLPGENSDLELLQTETPLTHPKYHFVTDPTSQLGQKYYVVFVGKCVGIFTFWPYVKTLIEGLKGVATFKGLDTFKLAAENYNKAKSIGIVRVMRFPGDELLYGPKSEGIQDSILL